MDEKMMTIDLFYRLELALLAHDNSSSNSSGIVASKDYQFTQQNFA